MSTKRSTNEKRGTKRRPKMTEFPPVRTIKMAVSLDFIKTMLEEKIEQFGFKSDDQILKIDLTGLPATIPMEVRFKKETEVRVTRRDLNGT